VNADWRGKNVLDFGGNIGNMLRDPNCTIDHERYWCLDVVEESIEKGRDCSRNRTGSSTIATASFSIRTGGS
jgi:hypothetical protein